MVINDENGGDISEWVVIKAIKLDRKTRLHLQYTKIGGSQEEDQKVCYLRLCSIAVKGLHDQGNS